MTLLQPWALSFLAAVPVIVFLYLLKLKRRPLPVSTLMFWKRVLQENRRHAFIQRLRHPLSLLLHLLIFLLILFALAKPEWPRLAGVGTSTVLIIDTRARMQAPAASGAGTCLDRARQLAAPIIGRAAPGHQIALLASHASTELITSFSLDDAPLRQGLARLRASDASGDLQQTVHLAEQLLAGRGGSGRIVVLTGTSGNGALTSSMPLEVLATGAAAGNVAITQFGTRPLPASSQTWEVLLEVANFTRDRISPVVELTLDDALLDIKSIELSPGERKVEIFMFAGTRVATGAGLLVARIPEADALPFDNVAYAVAAGAGPRRVLLVSQGNWFLEKVLAADEMVRFELLRPEAFRPDMAINFDAVILDDWLPSDFDLSNPRGTYLFIKQAPLPVAAASVELPLVTEATSSHALLRLVNLEDVRFLRATGFSKQSEIGEWQLQTPLRSFDYPLVVAGRRAKRGGTGEERFAVFAFDLADSDLPLRVAFPLLISNTIGWLAGEKSSPPAVKCGEAITFAPTQTIASEPQAFPNVGAAAATALQSKGPFSPLKNGFYRLDDPAGTPSFVAVNTFDHRESNLLATAFPPSTSAVTQPLAPLWDGGTLPALLSRPIWQFLALTALVLFTMEWWLFHFRKTE